MGSRTYLSIGMTIAAVAVGGWKGLVPGLDLAQASRDGSNPVAESASFVQAASALAAYQATAGTYEGAELAPTMPVRIAWATDAQYCLEGAGLHMLGPVGVPQPGSC